MPLLEFLHMRLRPSRNVRVLRIKILFKLWQILAFPIYVMQTGPCTFDV